MSYLKGISNQERRKTGKGKISIGSKKAKLTFWNKPPWMVKKGLERRQ